MNYVATLISTMLTILAFISITGSQKLIEKINDDKYNHVRMAQVRLLPKDVRSAVVRDYARKLPGNSEILIIGDSQLYGNRLPPELSIGQNLRMKAGSHVYNMAIIDGRSQDATRIIEILKEEGKKFNNVITNINPAHFRRGVTDPNHIPDTRGYSLRFSLLTTSDPGIYFPYVKMPYIKVPIVRNENKSVYKIDLYDEKEEYSETFNTKNITKIYLSDLTDDADAPLVKLLKTAVEISDHVYAFNAPMSYETFNAPPYKWGFDTSSHIRRTLAVCKKIPNVSCKDLSKAIPHEYFMDVVHLKPQGINLLSRKIYEEMQRDI